MKNVLYPYKFSTVEGDTYVGWWEGKKFCSEVFTSKQKKQAQKKFEDLRTLESKK